MDAIILGAGIAGLTAAFHLKKEGRSVLLLEKSSRWGGCIHSVREQGYLLEKGPSSFFQGQETLRNHVTQLGLQEEVIQAKEAAKKRFILSHKKLVPIPRSPIDFLKTPLLSLKGKCRFLMEPFISNRHVGEESVAQFVTRRLGKEAMHLVEPMVHGIYAGDPQNLSIEAIAPKIIQWEKEYGSLFKALKKARLFSSGNTLHSFKNGMQTLPNALFEKLREHCLLDCQEIEITKAEENWKIKWKHKSNHYEETARSLVIATPAYEAATLLQAVDPSLANLLHSIFYAPLVLLHLIVDRATADHPLDGFGFLTGADEEHFLLGSIWSSSVFENRCEDPSLALLSCFARDASHPEIMRLSEEDVISKALQELRTVLGSRLKLREAFVTWLPKALPQYLLGYPKKLREIRTHLAQHPGLHLVGNYLGGISVNDTMEIATTYDTLRKRV